MNTFSLHLLTYLKVISSLLICASFVVTLFDHAQAKWIMDSERIVKEGEIPSENVSFSLGWEALLSYFDMPESCKVSL